MDKSVKLCPQCHTVKPREEFYSRGDGTIRVQAKCKLCCSLNAYKQKEWRQKNPERSKHHDLLKVHGIGLQEYESILRAQDGVCAICLRPPGLVGTGGKSRGALAVDHAHESGNIRGLLCTNCNLGLGSFFDSVELLKRAATYLEKPPVFRPAKVETEVLLAELMSNGP